MKKIFSASVLMVMLGFSGCSNTENLQGKFSSTKPLTLVVSQGSIVGATNSITYGSESSIASFVLAASSTGTTVSVSTISFLLNQTGLYGPTYGISVPYLIYPVVSGVIDTRQPIVTYGSLLNDGTSGPDHDVLSFSLTDPTLGSAYALQVSKPQEYVILGPVIDDGTLNTNSISVATVSSGHSGLAKWAWSETANALTTDSFTKTRIVGSASSTSL